MYNVYMNLIQKEKLSDVLYALSREEIMYEEAFDKIVHIVEHDTTIAEHMDGINESLKKLTQLLDND